MESTNELGFAVLTVTGAAAVNLPTPLYGDAAHTDLAGTRCNPMHAYIDVAGGDVRYRLDGTEVVETSGILAKDGSVIDWTDPLRSFQSFIERFSVIAVSADVQLNISWRS